MPEISLPDGSVRSYNSNVSVADVAQDIGEGLARAALAGIVNEQLVDLSHIISSDAELSIVTRKK